MTWDSGRGEGWAAVGLWGCEAALGWGWGLTGFVGGWVCVGGDTLCTLAPTPPTQPTHPPPTDPLLLLTY